MTAPHPVPSCTLLAGCGYVGTRLARRLAIRGPVLALVRSAGSAAALAAQGIPARAVDFDRPGPLDLPQPLGAIVYLAPPPRVGEGDARLGAFLDGLGTLRPEALVYVSTTGVYGDTAGQPVDEDSPTVPTGEGGRRRLAAETLARAWCAARDIRCVLLRVPAIYGPRRLPLERLERGEPVVREDEAGPGNRIHVDDLVAACEAALTRPLSGVVNVTDGYPDSMGTFQRRLAALAGLPPPPEVGWAGAQRVLSPGLLGFLREARRVRSRRLTADLGVVPRPPDAGIRDSLREMRWPE